MESTYRHPVDYSTGQPGDHAPADCAELRRIADARYVDRLPADESAGGYHAGWGICAGTVQARSIHDEEVNAMRERVAATWVQRAMAGTLPTKEYAR